jgi:hypothetical protein
LFPSAQFLRKTCDARLFRLGADSTTMDEEKPQEISTSRFDLHSLRNEILQLEILYQDLMTEQKQCLKNESGIVRLLLQLCCLYSRYLSNEMKSLI